jgi:hypothetical protein
VFAQKQNNISEAALKTDTRWSYLDVVSDASNGCTNESENKELT